MFNPTQVRFCKYYFKAGKDKVLCHRFLFIAMFKYLVFMLIMASQKNFIADKNKNQLIKYFKNNLMVYIKFKSLVKNQLQISKQITVNIYRLKVF